MPRYYFRISDGPRFDDLQGTELPDLADAREEALRFASGHLTGAKPNFWTGEEWTMRVTDDADLTLFTLMFVATNSAATKRIVPARAGLVKSGVDI